MKATELRIGNKIDFASDIGTVKFIGEKSATIEIPSRTIRTGLDDIEPILLTEEWLLKFGFHKSLENWYGNQGVHVHGNTIWLFKVNFNDSWRVSIVEQSITYVTYVHQLQNLYFALTGKELQVNE